MAPEIRRPGKPLSEVRLAAVEQEWRFTFPQPYRDFLLKHNGGTPDPDAFARKGKKRASEVCSRFLGIDTGRTYDDLVAVLKNLKDPDDPRIPLRLVGIADDPFGNLICISVGGEDVGKIYFWDHEHELMQELSADGAGPDDAALDLVADSFDAFLEQSKKPRAAKASAKKGKTAQWPTLIKRCDVEGMKAWLESGGSLKAQTRDFETPLSLAIHEEQPGILDSLLDHGADAASALEYALHGEAWDLAHRILDRIEHQHTAVSSFTFQQVLQKCGDVLLIERLLDAGAPLHARMQRGNALYHATEDRADPAVIRLLLDRGAEVGAYGHMGHTALINAICVGSLETCRMLIDAGEKLYAVAPRAKDLNDEIIEYEMNKPKPDQERIRWHQSIIEHNRPRSAAWFLAHLKSARKMAAELIAYAASRGERPPEPSSR